ncbi:MAG: ANTAR domain-containing protein, partial [Nocardioides sp.]
DLMARLVETLGLAGSGVALAENNLLRFTAAMPERVVALERVQVDHRQGPCADAYHTGRIVAISHLSTEQARWPEYYAVAERVGITSAAGIPMHLSGTAVGALNLYADGPRPWREEDLAAATVMANMATSYLINASKLHQHQQLNEQLRTGLASKAIIEQAKGSVATTQCISVDEAFERIRRHARNHNVTVRAVAGAIVNLGLTI